MVILISVLLLCLGHVHGLVPTERAQFAGVAAVPPVTPAPPPTLTQDLEQIYRLIQFKPINQLFARYLLNDAQFQAFVRIINSREGFSARWRWRSQPEVVIFQQWANQQMLASGGPLEIEEGEVAVSLINPFPYWSSTVFGWQGFLNELQMYIPHYAIRAHIDAKLLQQGIFAQFWKKLNALQPVYERWLALPDTRRIVLLLQQAGIDTKHLDGLIREQLGWNVLNGTTVTLSTSALPMLPPIDTVIA